jgi:beta-N-acetylhexosaminidase
MPDLHREIGSLLVAGFSGTTLPSTTESLLKQGYLGGVILFARNYQNIEQITALTSAIKNADSRALIAVDQEGGSVVRFTGDFPTYPAASYFGEHNDPQGLVRATGSTASKLRSVDVNLNLTPVCDLRPSEPSHVIYSRAYSDQADAASEVVAAQVAAMHEQSILSCAKHFPGLQSGEGDPHHVESRTNRRLDDFRKRDYAPFRAAIEAGVDMVMVTHLTATEVDGLNPATYSSVFVQQELRGFLGFRGPIITDDLQMAAAERGLTSAQSAAKAILAGCNLLIFGKLDDGCEKLIDALNQKANENSQLGDGIVASAESMQGFKDRYTNRI